MSDLHDAAEAGDLERVQVLVEQGVDKDCTDNINNWTPLCIASQSNHLRVVRYLVEQGADMEKASGLGVTPLVIASTYGYTEVVQYLLEQGANRDKADSVGWTSLHYAAYRNHLEVAKLLMAYGADLNASDNMRKLPIDWACNEEIRQAIRDEAERRRDLQPRKRCIEEDRHPNAATSASAQQEEEVDKAEQSNKQPRLGSGEKGEVADEDQDSEPSSDEANH